MSETALFVDGLVGDRNHQSRLLVDVVDRRLEVVDALGHHHALRVLPRALADAVAGVGAGSREVRNQLRADTPTA
jgi:hypothetical protein